MQRTLIECLWGCWLRSAMSSGSTCTYRNAPIAASGITQITNHDMAFATISRVSPWKSDARATAGSIAAANAGNTRIGLNATPLVRNAWRQLWSSPARVRNWTKVQSRPAPRAGIIRSLRPFGAGSGREKREAHGAAGSGPHPVRAGKRPRRMDGGGRDPHVLHGRRRAAARRGRGADTGLAGRSHPKLGFALSRQRDPRG